METVSLIEEKKPRQKRTDADEAIKRSFLPPISRIHASLEPTAAAVAPAPIAPSVTQSTRCCRKSRLMELDRLNDNNRQTGPKA